MRLAPAWPPPAPALAVQLLEHDLIATTALVQHAIAAGCALALVDLHLVLARPPAAPVLAPSRANVFQSIP